MIHKISVTKPGDCYTWRVTYSDGTVVNEYDEERPDGRGWAEVDNEEIRQITLVPNASIPERSVTIPNGSPVFFRRRRIAVDPIIGTQHDIGTVHCIGWGFDPNVDTVKESYLFVFEDGSCLLSDNLQAV